MSYCFYFSVPERVVHDLLSEYRERPTLCSAFRAYCGHPVLVAGLEAGLWRRSQLSWWMRKLCCFHRAFYPEVLPFPFYWSEFEISFINCIMMVSFHFLHFSNIKSQISFSNFGYKKQKMNVHFYFYFNFYCIYLLCVWGGVCVYMCASHMCRGQRTTCQSWL